MFYSIIIPTYKREILLNKCLKSLAPNIQNFLNEKYEVIVSDDSFHTSNLSEYSFVKKISGPGIGPAANRNNGARYASGDWLIFLDDDIIPSKYLLTAYSNAINEYPNAIAFEGSIYPDDFDLMKKDLAECPINIDGGNFWSANICIKKSIFEKLNGFDVQFLIAAQEDQDIYKRLLQLGDVIFIKQASVIHPVRLIKLWDKVRNIIPGVQNWYKYEQKHNTQNIKRFLVTIFNLLNYYLRQLFYNFKKLKTYSFSYSLIWLFLGIPSYIYLFLKSYFKKHMS